VTTDARPGAANGFARFLGLAVAVGIAVAAAGWLPARRWGGEGALPALLAGCGIAVVASALGGVPLALAGTDPIRRPQAVLLALLLRLTAVLALGLAAIASGRFANRQLAIWTAAGYVAQLVVDSRYAMQAPLAAPRAAAAGHAAAEVDEARDGKAKHEG
jgi:hypothetical protein